MNDTLKKNHRTPPKIIQTFKGFSPTFQNRKVIVSVNMRKFILSYENCLYLLDKFYRRTGPVDLGTLLTGTWSVRNFLLGNRTRRSKCKGCSCSDRLDNNNLRKKGQNTIEVYFDNTCTIFSYLLRSSQYTIQLIVLIVIKMY